MATLMEKIDIRKLLYIIDNFDSLGNELGFKDGADIEGIKTLIGKYAKKVKRGGLVKVTYKRSHSAGRQNSKGPSLQTMKKSIRHTIAAEYYYDIDMRNAHPVLLSWYVQKHGLNAPLLRYNVENRDEFFNDILEDVNSKLPKEEHKTVGDMKILVLSIINGQDYNVYDDGILSEFADEMETLRENVVLLNEPLRKLAVRKKKMNCDNSNNIPGAVISLLMQGLENEALTSMVSYLKEKGMTVGSLQFDGLMVEKGKLNLNNMSQVLTECEEYVKKMTDLPISLVNKPMLLGINVPDDYKVSNYFAVKEKFEQENFKCMNPISYYCVKKGNIQTLGRSEFKALNEHLSFNDENGKKSEFVLAWMRDENIRIQQSVLMLPPPLTVPHKCYNLWDGFDIDKVQINEEDQEEKKSFLRKKGGSKHGKRVPNGLQLIQDHLMILSNEDPKCYAYLLKWIADMFQNPGRKNGIAICIKSKQGIGKDTLFSILEKMIGSKLCVNTAHAARDVLECFNESSSGNLFTVFNEANGREIYKHDSVLKDLITSETVKIRRMRTATKSEKSFSRFMFFTNTSFPIKVETDDRRIFAVEVENKRKPKSYFDKLRKVIDCPQTLRMFYDYLMDIDLGDVDWIEDRPPTQFQHDLVDNSTPREILFIVDLVRSNYCKGVSEVRLNGKELYSQFLNYTTCAGIHYETTVRKLSIKVGKIKLEGLESKRTNKGTTRILNINQCIDGLIEKGLLDEDFRELPSE